MQPSEIALIPMYTYHCQSSRMNASSTNATQHIGAPISISRRGPTTSISRPISGADAPTTPTVTENPSDTCARDQPK